MKSKTGKRQYIGEVEELGRSHVEGWLSDLNDMRAPQYAKILKNDYLVAIVKADRYRADVKLAGDSAGYCGFYYEFTTPLSLNELPLLDVVPVASGNALPISPSAIPTIPSHHRPNCFLVGAPRCGTTSMYYFLSQHPEIFVPRIKEPNFFAEDLEIATYPNINSLEAYLGLFEDATDHSVIVDGSQFHLYSRSAAAQIRDFSPRARIIIMLRDPLSLMRSLHTQYIKTGDETLPTLGDALKVEDERRVATEIPDTTLFPRCMAYLDVATLSTQVQRYLQTFERKKIHFIILDDLRRNASEVLHHIFQFLEVDLGDNIDTAAKNTSSAYTPLGFDNLHIDELARIRRTLHDDVLKLSQLLNRDLSEWAERVP